MPIVCRFGGGVATGGLPEFTYTGDYTFIDEGDKNWRIRFLTSGTLTFTKAPKNIDLFLVDGGSGGGKKNYKFNSSINLNQGGGGAGYTRTIEDISLNANSPYEIVIGAGGAISGNGGLTSALGYLTGQQSTAGGNTGGNGGSGGGAARNVTSSSGVTKGGVDGANGEDVSSSWPGGTGQGTTTREFGDAEGVLYSTGGDGGPATEKNGGDNTGDGGSVNAKGGSGIVVIRNHRG